MHSGYGRGGLVALGSGSGLVRHGGWPGCPGRGADQRPAQQPSDLGTRGGRAAAAVEDEGEGQEVGGTALDGKPGVPRVSGNESFLAWMARASGPIGLVIAAMSFYLFALVVWMALRYRTSIAMPGPLVRELHELLEQKKYSEAYHRLIADSSLLAQILTAGVRKLPVGLPMAHARWSWPMKTPPWRWSIARPTLPPDQPMGLD